MCTALSIMKFQVHLINVKTKVEDVCCILFKKYNRQLIRWVQCTGLFSVATGTVSSLHEVVSGIWTQLGARWYVSNWAKLILVI
jgi:hypothetical protein